MIETLVGALFGFLATLIGVLVTHYLTKSAESKKEKKKQAELLEQIAIVFCPARIERKQGGN